jgi:hypothetical protein
MIEGELIVSAHASWPMERYVSRFWLANGSAMSCSGRQMKWHCMDIAVF